MGDIKLFEFNPDDPEGFDKASKNISVDNVSLPDSIVPKIVDTIRCKTCGREDKFCQNCGTVSYHYRMYDGNHNTLINKDGKWIIYMFGEPLCIIRPIHIKAIIDSVKLQENTILLENDHLEMFLEKTIEDLTHFIKKMEENPNVYRLNYFNSVSSMIKTLDLLKNQIVEFNKINQIMNRDMEDIKDDIR